MSDEEILEVLREADEPVMTTGEIAEQLPIKRRGLRDRLTQLYEEGMIGRKDVGRQGPVWIWYALGETATDREVSAESAADRLAGFGAFAGDDGDALAEAVEQSREAFDEDYEERQRDLFGQ